MRVLLSESSKKELFVFLKEKYDSKSINDLAEKMDISFKTLQGWFYIKDRYIPEQIVAPLNKNLEILDRKEDNWGQLEGGKIAYKRSIERGEISKFKQKQSLGGKRAAKTKESEELKRFRPNLSDHLFLEFYGILLGDGWLSNFISSKKKVWLIGVSSNLKLDRGFVKYYRSNVEKLFDRKGTLRERKENNVSEFRFSHKILLKYLNEKLDFPIGKKENLKIPNSICLQGFGKLRHVIRGLFDTDGSFYLERNRRGIPSYPIISFHMNEIILIKQIGEILEAQGFRVNYSNGGKMIKIKGREQLKLWLNKIGSSNPYKLNKMKITNK